jgi:S1-C subfamily serine protease
MGHLMRVVGDLPAGVEIEMEIVRDGEPMQLAVTIGKRPSQYAPR